MRGKTSRGKFAIRKKKIAMRREFSKNIYILWNVWGAVCTFCKKNWTTQFEKTSCHIRFIRKISDLYFKLALTYWKALKDTPLREGSRYQIGCFFCKSARGGSFSIQKSILQILSLYIGLFLDVLQKNCNIIFQKWGGVRGRLEFLKKTSDLVAGSFPNSLV